MGQQDAKFSGQIFRKDNPLILACRRDLAAFMGIRVPYDSSGYQPGQILARDPADGLYKKWSGVSGSGFTSLVVLFDQCTDSDQLANNDGVLTGVSGSSLLRGLISAKGVYTNLLIDYNSTAKSGLAAKDVVDAAGTGITTF